MNEEEKANLRHLLLENKLDVLSEDVKEIKEALKEHYVTQDQFLPVKTIIYGLVGIILSSIVGALVLFVIRR